MITPDLLSPDLRRRPTDAPRRRAARRNVTLGAAVERLEREMIEAALQRTDGQHLADRAGPRPDPARAST